MNENELPERFLSLPRADQQLILDRYRELFEQLETEWKANPSNAGKPFSYRRMWDEFVNEADGEASA